MNSAYTVDFQDKGQTPYTLATGLWQESLEGHAEKSFDFFRMAKIAGFAVSLALSPLTAIPDQWLLERKRRDAVVTVSIYQEALGRAISRSEVLRIARQILEQAEQERLAIAELEAATGIQWGD